MFDIKKLKSKMDYKFLSAEFDKLHAELKATNPEMAAYMERHLVRDPVACTFMWKSPAPEDPEYEESIKHQKLLKNLGKKL